MEPLRDPRIDGNESPAETPRKPYIEPTQDSFPFKTVIGDLSIDKKGDVTHAAYVVFVWRKGPDGRISYYELDK